MFGTVIALLVSLMIFFNISPFDQSYYKELVSNYKELLSNAAILPQSPLTLLVASTLTLFILIAFISTLSAWGRLQQNTQNYLIKTEELLFKDRSLRFTLCGLFVLTFFSYLIVFQPIISISGSPNLAIIGALFLFGAGFDLLRFYCRRLFKFSNTRFVLELFSVQCLQSAKNGREKEAIVWLDSIFETLAKAIQGKSLEVASVALEQLQPMAEGFISGEARSTLTQLTTNEISNTPTDSLPTLLDRAKYLCLHISKRLEWTYTLAIREHVDPIAEEVLKTLARLSLWLANDNPILAELPVVFIHRCADYSLNNDMEELPIQAAATLSELSKSYITLAKTKNRSCKEITIFAISHLEEIVKAIFQKNKTLNAALLMQPFAEIVQQIGTEPSLAAEDKDEILTVLKRILNEFNALDLILTELPTRPQP